MQKNPTYDVKLVKDLGIPRRFEIIYDLFKIRDGYIPAVPSLIWQKPIDSNKLVGTIETTRDQHVRIDVDVWSIDERGTPLSYYSSRTSCTLFYDDHWDTYAHFAFKTDEDRFFVVGYDGDGRLHFLQPLDSIPRPIDRTTLHERLTINDTCGIMRSAETYQRVGSTSI